jgi:hypothetical protein
MTVIGGDGKVYIGTRPSNIPRPITYVKLNTLTGSVIFSGLFERKKISDIECFINVSSDLNALDTKMYWKLIITVETGESKTLLVSPNGTISTKEV